VWVRWSVLETRREKGGGAREKGGRVREGRREEASG
jgi:hypothetical protein